jgi:hypothetical protein
VQNIRRMSGQLYMQFDQFRYRGFIFHNQYRSHISSPSQERSQSLLHNGKYKVIIEL